MREVIDPGSSSGEGIVVPGTGEGGNRPRV